MKESTIKRNTPLHPKKAAFFKSLVEYFNSAAPTEGNPSARSIIDKINEFDTNGKWPNVQIGTLNVLDSKVVNELTPTHTRKIALYNALVKFFDYSLSSIVEAEYEEDEDNDSEWSQKERYERAENIINTFIPQAICGCVICEPFKSAVEESKRKRKFYVSVHFDTIFNVEVEANSEYEARQLARQSVLEAIDDDTIDNVSDDFQFVSANITDIEEIN